MNWVWLTLIFFLIALLAGIFLDARFAIISCMILFLLFPMELVMIYFYYGLRKECSFNVVDHRIRIMGDSLMIEMRFFNHGNAAEKEDSDEDDTSQISCVEFPLSQAGKYNVFNNSIALKINDDKGFVWIPLSAFDNDSQFKDFIDKILVYAVA